MIGLQCAMCRVQCVACSVQCSACSMQVVVCSVQCAVCSVQVVVCSVRRAVWSVRLAVCSVQCAVCSEPPSVWSLYCADCSVQYLVCSVDCFKFFPQCLYCSCSAIMCSFRLRDSVNSAHRVYNVHAVCIVLLPEEEVETLGKEQESSRTCKFTGPIWNCLNAVLLASYMDFYQHNARVWQMFLDQIQISFGFLKPLNPKYKYY